MRWFHKHRFEPVAITQGTETYVKEGSRRPVTVVLLKCSCYAFDTERLDGHWTMEQLQAKK